MQKSKQKYFIYEKKSKSILQNTVRALQDSFEVRHFFIYILRHFFIGYFFHFHY